MSAAPIGVFDSGVGGLSILAGIHELMPRERLLYVADSRHAPYGPRGEDFIRARSEAIMQFFLDQGAKAVVVACNTATAAAVKQLRERHALPIIGVEPAVKPATEASLSGVVGVLATAGTIASDKFLQLQNRFAGRVEILTRACPGLVELIEAPAGEAALTQLLHEFIDPMLERRADVLVLGCTHYSLIRAEIQRVAGAGVRIVDTGTAVARELQRRLAALDLERSGTEAGGIEFFSSGEPAAQARLLERYWGSAGAVRPLT